MSENTIELKNIRSLSKMNFFIPDYQRGYRWSSSEAKQMLNDFKEFCIRKDNKVVEAGEFYCLQPIVVKKKCWQNYRDGKIINIDGYEVIDGQQRLTTLYILLKCVEQIREILYTGLFEMYSIKYETRLEFDSQQFLENIGYSQNNADEFIDFYYMQTVYDTMIKWMNEHQEYKRKIVDALLEENVNNDTGTDNANNIRVIWYEVTDEEKATSIDIFTRLNIGKIPLTNAELIKALLLRRGNFSDSEASMRQLQISTEWNMIEQKLQDDSFWYFLCRSSWPFKYENRIEFIFDLMKGRTKDSEFYFTFNEFNKELDGLKSNPVLRSEQSRIEYIWQEVKDVFQTFEEWYEDRTLYHYIGFLIEYGVDIKELKDKSLEKNKIDFVENFIKQIKIKELLKGIKLSELYYGDKNVKKVLLLFNILTVLHSNKSDMRFPFSKYKKEKWDIEHISSQTDKRIDDDTQRLEWINDMLEFFTGSSDCEKVSSYMETLQEEIKKLETNEKENSTLNEETLAKKKNELDILFNISKLIPTEAKRKIDDASFEDAFVSVQKYCGEDKLEDKDFIYNLTLLDAETNRGYGNAFFPIKRKRIISNDSQGIFIPIATKNVFLKYYTYKGNNIMFWDKVDAEDYYSAIEETLKDYLK